MAYQWLLFDADNTLFDFDRAAAQALKGAMASFDLEMKPHFQGIYRTVNKQCWEAFERGEIDQKTLRSQRFELFFEKIGLSADPQLFSKRYLEYLADGGHMIEGARELLEHLTGSYSLALITNGLKEVQRPRIRKARIGGMFHSIIVSDEIGSAKPHTAFFDFTFEQIGTPAKEAVLVIGDSLSSDMLGGLQYGLDTCWYNPTSKPAAPHIQPTFQIRRLADLLEFL